MALTLLCQGTLVPDSRPGDLSAASSPQWPNRALVSCPPAHAISRLLARSGPPIPFFAAKQNGWVLPRDSGAEAWIRHKFALPPDVGIGACAALTHSPTPSALIVRLVHLHAARDHLVLWPGEQLPLNNAETASLFEAARDWLRDEPITLRRLSAELWELIETGSVTPSFSTLRSASSNRASGRNIDAWLPQGEAARPWRRLMNEVQMLWHTHPVNERRSAEGLRPVNALWLEGLPPLHATRAFDRIVSDDPVLAGLATVSGAAWYGFSGSNVEAALAAQSERCLIDVPVQKAALNETEHTIAAVPTYEAGAWAALEQVVGLIRAKGQESSLSEIVLTGDYGAQCFSVPRLHRWRIWKKKLKSSWLVEPIQQRRENAA